MKNLIQGIDSYLKIDMSSSPFNQIIFLFQLYNFNPPTQHPVENSKKSTL